MANRKIQFIEGEYYHIYNRGNSKQKIFLDDEDYSRFCKLLYLCNSEKRIDFKLDIIQKNINAFDFDREELIVSIGAWVLMPNHFHIYIALSRKSNFRNSKISEFMRKVGTAYSKYFNTKYNRTGSLFEGNFKTVHIENDIQAKYLFSYIHLNPIKLIQSDWKEIGIQDKDKTLTFLQKYKWSSYLDFKGVQRSENKILNIEDFPGYFQKIDDFNREILSWIENKE
jgi:putative transposase